MGRYKTYWSDAGGVMHPPAPELDLPAEVCRYKRVVSLVPSLTESAVEIMGAERLVGITAFCIRPDFLLKQKKHTVVGGTKRIVREKLMRTAPDLVLVNLEENELDEIEWLKARIPCYINGVKTLRQGIETIRELGALLERPLRAEALAQRAETQLVALLQQGVKKLAHRRIFYPIWREPWMTIGPDTFIADHLRTLCLEPVPSIAAKTRYPQVTIAEIVAAQPDLIWLPSEPYRFKVKHRDELQRTPGLEHVPIRLVDGDAVCWFGVRQIEGLSYTSGLFD